jgi:hypothetical protein
MLPGALQAQPSPDGKTAPGAGPKTPRTAGLKAASEETVAGRELLQNGGSGSLVFDLLPGNGLEITKLSLSGESLSHRAEECRVDIIGTGPITAKFTGRPRGASHYDVEIEACPFSFDVLEGAVLVSSKNGRCDFAVADCKVDPAGLWGPSGNSFGPSQTKGLESERGRAEANMRANFRALLASAGKDKEAIKRFARDQAGFSSERETICRKYLREDEHGFCALRITQARALDLEAAAGELAKKHAAAKQASQQARMRKNSAADPKVNAKANPTPAPQLPDPR